MRLLSLIFRVIFRNCQSVASHLRVLRLKMLYPGLEIDYRTRIESKVSIVCVKGGRLRISRSKISFGTCIIADSGSEISIESSFIGRNCVITSKKSVRIAEGCLIAEMVVIRDQDHHLDRRPSPAGSQDAFTSAPIAIESHAWVASKATILKGVRIGSHSVIGASAVVNREVPPGELWVGIPAKFLKKTSPTA